MDTQSARLTLLIVKERLDDILKELPEELHNHKVKQELDRLIELLTKQKNDVRQLSDNLKRLSGHLDDDDENKQELDRLLELLNKQQQRETDVYSFNFLKRKTYDEVLERLTKEASSDAYYLSIGLSSTEDQIRIVQDMKENEIPLTKVHSLGSLFCHVDNIRLLYQDQGKTLPDWFHEKYKSKLKSQ